MNKLRKRLWVRQKSEQINYKVTK